MDENKPVLQLRVVVEGKDFDAAVRFYRDVLGLPERIAMPNATTGFRSSWQAGPRWRSAPSATRRGIDEIEAGGQESPLIRPAFEVTDWSG